MDHTGIVNLVKVKLVRRKQWQLQLYYSYNRRLNKWVNFKCHKINKTSFLASDEPFRFQHILNQKHYRIKMKNLYSIKHFIWKTSTGKWTSITVKLRPSLAYCWNSVVFLYFYLLSPQKFKFSSICFEGRQFLSTISVAGDITGAFPNLLIGICAHCSGKKIQQLSTITQ